MAKKTICFCDRCGKEFSRKGFTQLVSRPRKLRSIWWNDSKAFYKKEFDLCNGCSSAFDDFITNKKVEPRRNNND